MLKTYLDEELMDRAEKPELLRELLAGSISNVEFLRHEAEREGTEENATRLGRELQRLGEYLRLDGQYEAARKHKEEAIAIWAEYGRERAHFLARYQRAMVIAEGGEGEEALEILEGLFGEMGEKTRLYEDFLWEGKGRALYRVGKVEEAREAMGEALAMRERRGNGRHIEETKAVIAMLEAKLA